jgi:hypothetical protein
VAASASACRRTGTYTCQPGSTIGGVAGRWRQRRRVRAHYRAYQGEPLRFGPSRTACARGPACSSLTRSDDPAASVPADVDSCPLRGGRLALAAELASRCGRGMWMPAKHCHRCNNCRAASFVPPAERSAASTVPELTFSWLHAIWHPPARPSGSSLGRQGHCRSRRRAAPRRGCSGSPA